MVIISYTSSERQGAAAREEELGAGFADSWYARCHETHENIQESQRQGIRCMICERPYILGDLSPNTALLLLSLAE